LLDGVGELGRHSLLPLHVGVLVDQRGVVRAVPHVGHQVSDAGAPLDLFHTAYEQRTEATSRSRFNDLAHLVAAQVAVRTWPDAEVSLAQLAVDAASVRSGRTTALLQRVLRRIGTDSSASPRSIIDCGEQLGLALDEAD